MAWATIGSAGRADDADGIPIRIAAGTPRRYRVRDGDVPSVPDGCPAILYTEEGEPAGDIAASTSGRMLLGASRAGRGFVPDGTGLPVRRSDFAIPRDHPDALLPGRRPVAVLRGGVNGSRGKRVTGG
ncbi:MAG: hypothetical protein ABFC89_07720 [Methanospirillum sp.]